MCEKMSWNGENVVMANDTRSAGTDQMLICSEERKSTIGGVSESHLFRLNMSSCLSFLTVPVIFRFFMCLASGCTIIARQEKFPVHHCEGELPLSRDDIINLNLIMDWTKSAPVARTHRFVSPGDFHQLILRSTSPFSVFSLPIRTERLESGLRRQHRFFPCPVHSDFLFDCSSKRLADQNAKRNCVIDEKIVVAKYFFLFSTKTSEVFFSPLSMALR